MGAEDLVRPARSETIAFPALDRFRPLARIGEGSMGLVYRVYDSETDSELALKTFSSITAEQLYRLKQEFRTLRDITHPHLIELYELFVVGQRSFFTMELIDGQSLSAFLGSAPLAIERLTDVGRQIGEALAALHAAGKLHCDLKPSNVMVTADGRVVILDFGLATAFGPGIHNRRAGVLEGTLAYMPPEVFRGQPPTPASDWYSAGVILYEALAGVLPYQVNDLMRSSERPPPSLRDYHRDVSVELDDLISRMLARAPEKRPAVAEILGVLGRGGQRAAVSLFAKPFVGREPELEALRAAFNARETTQVVHVIGPSGIGKSELLHRFTTELEQHGALVLRGRCHPQESVPYKAFDGIVDELSVLLSDEHAQVPPVNAPAPLVRLFPVLARIPAYAAGEPMPESSELREIRRRGVTALGELMSALATRRRTVLWIDDFHWSDIDSGALLRELLRLPDLPSLLVILSYRNEDRTIVSELLDADASHGVPERVLELGALPPEETADLARRLCLAQIESDQRIAAIVAEARGNPFFVSELASSLTEHSEHVDLSKVIVGRVDRLPESARCLLDLVSIAGVPLRRSVILEAAGLSESARPLLRNLEKRSLLRTTSVAGAVAIEIFHDRIRQALLANLPAVSGQRHHAALADVLERQPEADAEALLRHHRGAGNRERAAEWAMQAAHQAHRALAFQQEADLYAQALELGQWSDERHAELQGLRAEALVNAGRGAAAAEIFESLAGARSGVAAAQLRSRAAEHFLVSGHLERGAATLAASLETLSIRYVAALPAVMAATLGRLAALRLRDFRPGRATAPAGEMAIARIDAYHAAAKGLVLVDPIRGLYFAVRSASQARRCGDSVRLARALAALGAALVPAGGPTASWALRMVERAEEISAASDDPYLRGFTKIARAQVSMVNARWREMLELCDTGRGQLRESCRGVSWELNIATVGVFRAREELGRLSELHRDADLLLQQAEERGDRYAQVTALLRKGLCVLMSGDVALSRQLIERVAAIWPQRTFNLQNFYALRTQAYGDLAAGDAPRAWQRIVEAWPAMKKAGIFRHALMRPDAYLLRMRTALALAHAYPERRATSFQAIDEDLEVLAKDVRADLRAHALLVTAARHAMDGNVDTARVQLTEAARRFAALDMALAEALTRARLAQLEQSDVSTPAVAQYFEAEQRADRSALLRMWAPGFDAV